MTILFREYFALAFRRFTRVAARLLHKFGNHATDE
jgi:hypothetical protein